MSSSASSSGSRDSCPSCQVCSGEASGFHYGVDSCEGCKGFFRRCITQGMTNRCANDEKCEITPFSRNSCQFCRLKKCFAVGMSREGSRLGRRPKRLKGCHGSETKPGQKVTDVCQSSTASSKTPSFGQMTEERKSLIQRSDSSASETYRLSISSEGEPTTSRSDYCLNLPLIGKDGCYYRSASYPSSDSEQNGMVHHKSHPAAASSSAVSSGTVKTEPFINSVDGLPAKMKFHDNRQPFSSSMERPGCLRPANEPAIGGTEPCGAELPHSLTTSWSEYVKPLSGMGSAGRIVKGFNRVYDHVPETMTLAGQSRFIKREVTKEESALCEDDMMRAFEDCPLSDLSTSRDSSFAHDCLVNSVNDHMFVNSSEGLCYGHVVKEEKLDSFRDRFSGRISESKGLEYGVPNILTTWKVDIAEPFGVGDDKLALPCTSSEPEEVAFPGSSSVEILIGESVKPPDRVKTRLIKHVIETVIEAHLSSCNYTAEKVAGGIQRYKEMSLKGQASKDMDPSKVWTHFVDNMAPVIKRVVKFSKKIPGFSELHQDDQISLIKQGSFEVILTRYTRLFTNDGMFVPNMTVFVPRDIMRQMPMGNFFEEQYHFAEMFNKLKLSDSEIGLLTAAMIVCPDRAGLMNCEAIRQLHLLLVQSLYDFMTRNHPDECTDLFSKTLNILPFVQRLNESHAKQLNNIKLSTPEIMFPPLHDEVFDKAG